MTTALDATAEPFGRQTDHFDVSFGGQSYMYTTQACRCEKCGRFKFMKVTA